MSKNKSKVDVSFSVNEYDYEGDIYEKGIFLTLNSFIKFHVGSMSDLDDLIKQLKACKKEISENYPNITSN